MWSYRALTLSLLGLCHSASAYSPPIQVYDNVISSAIAKYLHNSAQAVGLGHRSFARPLKANGTYGPIELALDAILSEMDGEEAVGDKKQYVEYWTRQEWRSIEAHADVDEFRAKEEDSSVTAAADLISLGPDGYRYPKYGHVLYLQVGSNVRGPTCIWPGRRSGGELLRDVRVSTEPKEDEGDAEGITDEESCNAAANIVEMLIVPALRGRLLRFPGSALHAVPRPHDFWFLPFVMGSASHTPAEAWGRSVVLFNIWEDDPPKGVSLNSGEGHKDEPVEGTGEEDVGKLHCRAKVDWKPMSISGVANDADDEIVPAKVWLLGNERRRDHPMRTVKLSASIRIQDALAEEELVSRVWMDNELG